MKRFLFQMNEIERALDRLEKAVGELKHNFNKGRSLERLVEQKSTINENELSELKSIKSQISDAITDLERFSLAENKESNNKSLEIGENNQAGDG